MPRYDYECEIGHRFELKQSFGADPVADCPECGRQSARQFSAVPIVFKGSGWYVNDYGKKGSASTSSAGKDEANSAKSDKPAAKSEKAGKGAAKEKAAAKSGD